MVVFVAQSGELFGGQILDPQVGRVGAAIMFAGPDAGMALEGELGAVGRIDGPGAPVGIDGALNAARRGNLPESGDRRESAVPAGGRENDVLSVGRPTHNVVVGAVKGQLTRLAAGGGNHKDVVVAFAIGGKGDPLAVRREARKLVARLVDRQAFDAGAVF